MQENSLADICKFIQTTLGEKTLFIIGIDGESYTGKTTFGKYLASKFPDITLISLDSYLGDPEVRKNAYRDPKKRDSLFRYWFDENKIVTLRKSLQGHVIIEGTFLLAGLPREVFDLVFVVKSSPDLTEKRIVAFHQKNKGLSLEEAQIFDDVYHKSWQKYIKMFHKEGSIHYIDLPR